MFHPTLYDDETEIFSNDKFLLKNKIIKITNYRIFQYDKKYKIVIKPIALPTDVVVSDKVDSVPKQTWVIHQMHLKKKEWY